jgi:hypothetical protein
MCSGKVYYDLCKSRKEQGKQKEIAIVRLEQVKGRVCLFSTPLVKKSHASFSSCHRRALPLRPAILHVQRKRSEDVP